MKFEQEIIFEKYVNTILNEGGAAGHMMHPFDLPRVITSTDLLNTFNDIVKKLKKGTSTIKLDGVNISIKVVDKPLTETIPKQFALDRGSQKEIDVNGITTKDLSTRFPSDPVRGEHGMVSKGKTILTIMNKAMMSIKTELQTLDLWDNPTKFINSEYISGKENVVDYGGKKFIAFHGINQFYKKVDRQGVTTRPGLDPTKTVDKESGKIVFDKSVSRKVKYNYNALEELRIKVKPYAEEFGFDIVTGIYVKKLGEPNFSKTLLLPFTVKFSKDETVTKPLKEWISKGIKLPKNKKISIINGRSIGAISKENYTNVLDSQIPLNELYQESDIPEAVAGALTYHLTKELGNEILNNFTTDNYGHASEHEGIVLTDPEYGQDMHGNSNSVKITGEFILSGMSGAFSKIPTKLSTPSPDEEDQSAPEVNHGGGKMNFSTYFNNPPK